MNSIPDDSGCNTSGDSVPQNKRRITMKLRTKKIFASFLVFVMVLSMFAMPSTKAKAAAAEAYLAFADSSWGACQYWGGTAENGVVATNAVILGAGQYTVGVDFTGTADGAAAGIAFTAPIIANGELVFPGCFINIDSIKVNGVEVEFTKNYTSSDDGISTRSNVYNTWVSELPEDARRADGDLTDASAVIVSADAFASVETVEVTFTLIDPNALTAYLAYADASWGEGQYWGSAAAGVVNTDAVLCGTGTYSVGLDFTGITGGAAAGCAFTALMIPYGEILKAGSTIEITGISINGVDVADLAKCYTSSDDKICTRSNIYNSWVGELPEDARRADGDLTDCTPMIVANDVFANVETIVVTFTFRDSQTVNAYLAYADANWGDCQYWGGAATNGVEVSHADINGTGSYTVGLDFTGTASGAAPGCAFTAVMIENGEIAKPGCYINITEIKVNGEAITIGKNYTSSDDKICTRSNVYNAWVGELPEDARSISGDLTDCTPTIVNIDDLASVETIEVTFQYIDPEVATMYLAYSDANWGDCQYWGGAAANDVIVYNAYMDKSGDYIIGLDFTKTADGAAPGCAFTAMMYDFGETMFPNSYIKINKIEVNGTEVALGKNYTSSDDGVCTRSNIYNGWVGELPSDARTEDGDLTDCTPTIVNIEDLAAVETIVVYYTWTAGEGTIVDTIPEPTDVPALPALDTTATYHAYLGIQSSAWAFRNNAHDSKYGIDSGYFYQMSLVNTDSTVATLPGTFTDVEIKGDGTYTVAVDGSEFSDEDTLNLLFVSTDIPLNDQLTFTDVKVKFGGSTKYTFDEAVFDPDAKDFVCILAQNIWNSDVKDLFGYALPCDHIEMSFTVTGFGFDNPDLVAEATATPAPTATTAPAATTAPTTAPAADVNSDSTSGNNTVLIIVIIAVVVVAAAGIVTGVIVSKKKKVNQ